MAHSDSGPQTLSLNSDSFLSDRICILREAPFPCCFLRSLKVRACSSFSIPVLPSFLADLHISLEHTVPSYKLHFSTFLPLCVSSECFWQIKCNRKLYGHYEELGSDSLYFFTKSCCWKNLCDE